jgi:hypothetical protein
MLYIAKSGITQRALNALKRLAAFKNPEFYRAQAMRMPTRNKPRIISCAEETPEYLCLPSWYGSINLLSYGSAHESIMRLESPNIAQELVKDLRNSGSA